MVSLNTMNDNGIIMPPPDNIFTIFFFLFFLVLSGHKQEWL